MSIDEKIKPNVNYISQGKLSWYHIEKPTATEVEYLADKFNFHPLDLDDVLSRVQRPKIDEYEDRVFMVLHFPVFDREHHITRPTEIVIFIGENYVVTVNKSVSLKPLAKLFQDCQSNDSNRQKYMGRSSGFLLYNILDRLVNYCFPVLSRITENIDNVEDVIFTKTIPKTVHEISLIRRDLISFRRIIRPQIAVIETLENEEYPFFREDQEIYFGDVADHYRKIWDGLEDCKEVVDGLAETSNWLTSHRIQGIMSILTIVMALLAPATLIASIFGMNIPLPGGINGGSLVPLIVIGSTMLLISVGMFAYLRHHRWF
jgi:magnesium transporter